MKASAEADCVVVITDHKGLPYREILDRCQLMLDTRNALKGVHSDKLFKL